MTFALTQRPHPWSYVKFHRKFVGKSKKPQDTSTGFFSMLVFMRGPILQRWPGHQEILFLTVEIVYIALFPVIDHTSKSSTDKSNTSAEAQQRLQKNG
jgi:hypothetical protein